eukprot:Gregarina_sp_Poly_1__63@NODE_1012_length_5366_cov_118_438762_g159_i2_p1_GENE_NODE_1012_length_5366_cov_118_438762_g159_i2NODE_1012_length_5366_cov_118_438762_g159_i2_p1_ORF_typecomplete_len535_score99_74TPR_15/PF13429_6/0_00017TPR_15/PF13429_6/0_00012TPR_16/PF13432_6/3e03TPR_16/PF13432_6/3_7e02TPR_16/PF13432_6/2_6e07ANAPC3/PF12895_7/2_1e03ANAPC3/PF12895_7/1_6e06TPR_19/PF14559_6/1_1e02TPR_19/PF14559_6/5_2e06TPR_21/PF09976_9/7e03TPR_21/PF09976_9/1_1e05BTAD/PF03704_17/5_6e03BTAD/PF03704_17/0_0055DU
MNSGDYYWQDEFARLREWTDAELQRSDFVDDAFSSILVVPQRRRKRLQEALANKDALLEKCLFHPEFNDDPIRFQSDIALQFMQKHCLNLVGGNWKSFFEELNKQQIPCFRDLKALKETEILANDHANEVFKEDHAESLAETKKDHASLTHLEAVSHKPFELRDVPQDELRRRLNRGEIAPKDEWIPSSDTKQKKSVSIQEAHERLKFAETLKKDATEKMQLGQLEEAATVFAQGSHLLEYYKCDSDSCVQEQITSELRRFRLNYCNVNLKLKKYREAIKFLDDQLKEDPNDGRSIYLRGRCYELAGDFEKAWDQYYQLFRNVFVSDSDKLCGLYALHRLRGDYKENSSKLRMMVEMYQKEIENTARLQNEEKENEYFEDELLENELFPQTSNGRQFPTRERLIQQKSSQSSQSSLPQPTLKSADELINLLALMLKLYTSPNVALELEKIRIKADFDERKVLLALRKYLPSILSPLLMQFGYGSECDRFVDMKTKFDKDVYFYRAANDVDLIKKEVISGMVKSLHETLMGTAID